MKIRRKQRDQHVDRMDVEKKRPQTLTLEMAYRQTNRRNPSEERKKKNRNVLVRYLKLTGYI